MNVQGIPVEVLAPAVVITGLVVVFLALVGLWLIMALFGKAFASVNRKESKTGQQAAAPVPQTPAAPVQTVQKAAPPAIESGISEEVVAVISAAVAAMDSGYTLTGVKRAAAGGRGDTARSAWARAGLLQNTQPF